LTDTALIEHSRERAGRDQPILEGVAHARRRLRSIGERPPAAVRRPRDVDCVRLEMNAAGGLEFETRPQEIRVRKNQRRGDQPFLQ
jgi:hypothetical protein